MMIISMIAYIAGFQIWKPDVALLFHRYNYRKQKAQFISIFFVLLLLGGFVVEACCLASRLLALALSIVAVVVSGYIFEWLLTRINPSGSLAAWAYRLLYVALMAFFMLHSLGMVAVSPFALLGVIVRNSPLGIPFPKLFCLSHFCRRGVEKNVGKLTDEIKSHVGKQLSSPVMQEYLVTDFGVQPAVHRDQTKVLQQLIDMAGENGGGRIVFPAGKFYFHTSKDNFIKINHSHITLEGAVSDDGRLLTELVSLGSSVSGERNPWISPFFITTGEALQRSNIFFGLQFRNKAEKRSHSGSLTDPGSDGSLLEPKFATSIVENAYSDATMLHVESSAYCGKYMLIGMYNTDDAGSLIHSILGTDNLRGEWTSACRAGVERAPSFQWLVEVKRVVDEHTIELTRPLLCDIEMRFTPEVYNVDMLEDVNIRNLRLNSSWNGVFHHHGIPLYYSVARSQEMDYGWNGINMKRVAHGEVVNVQISNFTNPLYVLDSRNVSVKHVCIDGHDGHQGIKVYQHACDNLFSDITFCCHFADMMGGEGNAYGNVFHAVRYANPDFHPVDFDFHGFSEGPMSPPAYNLFTNIRGFRYIQSAAGKDMLPGCAQHNSWDDVVTEGECAGDPLFRDLAHTPKRGVLRFVTAVGYTIVVLLRSRDISVKAFWHCFRTKLHDIDNMAIPPCEHHRLFVNAHLKDITTTCTIHEKE